MAHHPQSLLARSWNKLAPWLPAGIAPQSLDADTIIQSILKRHGQGQWLSGAHIEALHQLISALNHTGELHAFGRFYVREMLSGMLDARARLEQHWTRHPDILTLSINKPLIILGLPRSGTSFLFNLLAQDPAHRYLRNWETTVSQIPPARTCQIDQDPRRRTGRLLMAMQNHLAPELKHIHEFHLDGPEECTPLLMQGFQTQALAGMFNVPAYSSWLNQCDHTPDYAHHKRALQTLQNTYPAERWLLKSPDHLPGVAALLKHHPDACLIHLHRDPTESVASWASLNAAFRGICSSQLDNTLIGEQILNRLATDMEAYIEQRDQLGLEKRFMDIPYSALIRDPLGTVEQIYQHFNLDTTDLTRQSIQRFLSQDTKKARKHQYSPEKYGLTGAQILKRFEAYITRFNVQIKDA